MVDVKELFNSESKTQVYAHLHQLLNSSSMAKTGNNQKIINTTLDYVFHIKTLQQLGYLNPLHLLLYVNKAGLSTFNFQIIQLLFKNIKYQYIIPAPLNNNSIKLHNTISI